MCHHHSLLAWIWGWSLFISWFYGCCLCFVDPGAAQSVWHKVCSWWNGGGRWRFWSLSWEPWLMFSPPRCCGAGVNSDMDIERNGGLLMGTEVSELLFVARTGFEIAKLCKFQSFSIVQNILPAWPWNAGLPNLDMRWALERNGVLVRSFQGFGCPSSVHPKGLARVQASKKWPILLENSLEGFAGFWTSFACWNTLLFLF